MVQSADLSVLVNMVDRTNRYGDVVEELPEGYALNVKPFGKPLLLIFLQEKDVIMGRVGALPKVFYCKSLTVKSFINHCHHIITYVPTELIVGFVERLGNVSQGVVAIDLSGNKAKSLNIPFKFDFEDKSDDFIFEYLKEFLRVEN